MISGSSPTGEPSSWSPHPARSLRLRVLVAAGRRPGAGQAYQVPDGYAGYASGTVVVYGGSSYTIGLSGTMTLVSNYTYSSNCASPGGSRAAQARVSFAIPVHRAAAISRTRSSNSSRTPGVGVAQGSRIGTRVTSGTKDVRVAASNKARPGVSPRTRDARAAAPGR